MARYPQEEKMWKDLPVIDTPFTRLVEHVWTSQTNQCRDLEMDYVRCMGMVGQKRGEKDEICAKYRADWMECTTGHKAQQRWQAMQNERKKQNKPFKEAPAKDSIFVPIDYS